jgi:hypothetical protein
MSVKPTDEYMHENTGEANFNESMYFNFYDRDAKLGGFVRIGNRPNEHYAEMTMAVYLPDHTALFMYKRPQIVDNKKFAAGGMEFTVHEPFKRLSVSYDGHAVYLAQPLDLADPKQAFTSNPFRHVQLQLEYEGLSPMYGGEHDGTNTEMVFAKGHYEQHVRATGRIAIDGQETPISGFGLRDHSWGPRSWQSPKFYRWLTCEFDAGFGFMGSQIVTQSGSEWLSGFVFQNGENHFVHHVDLQTEWSCARPQTARTHGAGTERGGTGGFAGGAEPIGARSAHGGESLEDRYHDRLAVKLKTTAGDTFDITGKVLTMLPLRNRREGKVTRISEGLTEWRCGAHVGYGWSEYLDQMD